MPFSLKEPLEKELSQIERLGFYRKSRIVSGHSVVVVPKYDACLVCDDYKTTVNPVLVVDKYPLLRPDDLMSQLAGGQGFLKSGLQAGTIK